MMGQWTDVRSASGRLLCRIDGDRRLLEIVRNGDETLIDLDAFIAHGQEVQRAEGPAVGPGEVKEGG